MHKFSLITFHMHAFTTLRCLYETEIEKSSTLKFLNTVTFNTQTEKECTYQGQIQNIQKGNECFKQSRPHRLHLPRFSINIKTPEQIMLNQDKGTYRNSD